MFLTRTCIITSYQHQEGPPADCYQVNRSIAPTRVLMAVNANPQPERAAEWKEQVKS